MGRGSKGAWAAQVDEEEKANGGTLEAPKEPIITFGQDKAFPTLGEAVKKKESKKDKKKPQKMNLADFQSNYKPPTASRRPTISDDQLLASLPTAPRARDGDEPSAGLGGAFRDYGGGDRGDGDRHRDRDRGSFFGRRDRDGDSQDGSDGAFGDEPSRADAVDDWGATRKFVPSSSGGGSGGFGSGGFGSRREERGESGETDGPSRADTTDDWGATRKFTPSSAGFEDRASSRGFGSSRRGGDDDFDGAPSRADAESRWGKKVAPSSGVSSGGSSGGGFEDRPRDRDSEGAWGARRTADAPDAAAGGGGRPRLKLAPRTKPPPVLDIPPEARVPEKKEPEPLPVTTGPPKPKANPFGAARPREEVLKEQGRDWKKEEQALKTKDTKDADRWTNQTTDTSEITEGMEKLPQEVASLPEATGTEAASAGTDDGPSPTESEPAEGVADTSAEDTVPESGAEATD